MILSVVVGIAAGLGAVCRYVLDQLVEHRHESDFPYGTLVVNLSGSLLLGLVTGLSLHSGLGNDGSGNDAGLGNDATVALSAGFCGGYTTWSTFAYESVALAEGGELLAATANLLGSLGLGLIAAAAGLGLALLI